MSGIKVIRIEQAADPTSFFDEPLGFRGFGVKSLSGFRWRCQGLLCWFLCAMLGFNDPSYITSRVDSRQCIGLQL